MDEDAAPGREGSYMANILVIRPFKIGRVDAGNGRYGNNQFVSTDLPFARGRHRKVVNLIGKMQDLELNVGLAKAYELLRGSTEVTGAAHDGDGLI